MKVQWPTLILAAVLVAAVVTLTVLHLEVPAAILGALGSVLAAAMPQLLQSPPPVPTEEKKP